MTRCCIWDIDGTIADCSHRTDLHIVARREAGLGPDWDAVFAPEAVLADRPIFVMISLLNSLYAQGWQVLFMTGRPLKTWPATKAWLGAHTALEGVTLRTSRRVIPGEIPVFMRENDDHRDDDILKSLFLDWAIEAGHNPTLAFEDRDRIVAMFRDRGIRTCQPQPGAF